RLSRHSGRVSIRQRPDSANSEEGTDARVRHLSRHQSRRLAGRSPGRPPGRPPGRSAAGGASLVLRLLSRRVGILPEATCSAVVTLSVAQIESLGEALLEFTDRSDLQTWLAQQQQQLAAAVQQLTTQLGALSPQVAATVQVLSAEQLAELQSARANWTNEADLATWLQAQTETDETLGF
ncbi:MAG: DUF4351 domain-containing protein, partial [Leptolyngbyaceae cyanobacterium SM2_5_2]|nr:DUF4351 domain-containing protein [Leptolyngbyaceae cyanobacterium SM2_5_2]